MICKNCKCELKFCLTDMGFSPYANSYLRQKNLNQIENHYPLRVLVCKKCFMVQTQDFANPNVIFSSDYAYYSSTSKIFLDHAENYVEKIIRCIYRSLHWRSGAYQYPLRCWPEALRQRLLSSDL